MKPLVSIIMGSTSDYNVMEKAALFLNEQEIPFEINALSAHRTPKEVSEFASNAENRGIKVIIAAAGMAAALPGAIAAETILPVIGVPIKSSFEGMDSVLSMLQMPPAVPVSVMAVNGALNAGIMAMEILAQSDESIKAKMHAYKESLKQKIVKANEEFSKIEFKYKTN